MGTRMREPRAGLGTPRLSSTQHPKVCMGTEEHRAMAEGIWGACSWAGIELSGGFPLGTAVRCLLLGQDLPLGC